MKTTFDYPQQKAELKAFLVLTPIHKLKWKGRTVEVLTGDDIPAAVVPAKVTPRQIRLALTASGLRATVEAAVSAGSQDLKDWWEYALDIERSNPLINAMATQLNIASDDVDNLFRLAASL